MANVNEVIDRQIDPMGHINPAVWRRCTDTLLEHSLTHTQVAPLTEKSNVFNTSTEPHEKRDSPSDSEKEFETEKTVYVGELEEIEMRDEETIADPFEPFHDIGEERRVIVTIRAMLVGCICGALVNASNVYLGLKTGWTFGKILTDTWHTVQSENMGTYSAVVHIQIWPKTELTCCRCQPVRGHHRFCSAQAFRPQTSGKFSHLWRGVRST